MPMPEDPAASNVQPDPACLIKPLRSLDVHATHIGAVIWATGYGVDFDWIDVPVLDARGEPVHNRGITDVPGLYFRGLQWLSKMNSSFLAGIGDDAARLADHIVARVVARTSAVMAQ
jgi:putative flavoprotein involved in K+ transport